MKQVIACGKVLMTSTGEISLEGEFLIDGKVEKGTIKKPRQASYAKKPFIFTHHRFGTIKSQG